MKPMVPGADLAGRGAADLDRNRQTREMAAFGREANGAELRRRQPVSKAVVISQRAVQGFMVIACRAPLGALFVPGLRTEDGCLNAAEVVFLRTTWTVFSRGVTAAGGVIVHLEGSARVVTGKSLHAVATVGAIVDGAVAPSGELVTSQDAEQRT